MQFDLIKPDGAARRGRLAFPRGTIETPAFMPVGTRAAIKSLTIDQVRDLDAEIILANTYHLHVRPGDAFFFRLNCTVGYYSAPGAKSRVLAVRSWYPGMEVEGMEH